MAERLRARQEQLVETIFARVRDDVSSPFGADDAEYMAGLRAAVAAALGYLLERVELGEQQAPSIPAAVSEQARRAARIGVSLDTVLRRYVHGSALLGEFVMEETDSSGFRGGREVLREVLRAQASALDLLLAAITAEYEDERMRTARSPERKRAELVHKLLATASLTDVAELDYELDAEHVGLLAKGADSQQVLRALAARLDRRLLSVARGREATWAWLGGQPGLSMSDLKRGLCELLIGVTLAVGEPAYGLEGWRLTHQQSQAALAVALRRPRTYTRYADVALLASALKDESLARALIDVYIAPLADSRDGGRVLYETLRAYFAAERNASSAAAALGVVRNTVDNRLRTIEERLGRTLHPCPAELEVALQLHELGACLPGAAELTLRA